MAPPPAKRQRRLILSSDDEVPQNTTEMAKDDTKLEQSRQSINTRTTRRKAVEEEVVRPAATTKRKVSASTTPTSSPDKRRSRKGPDEAVKSKSLHSFFSKASEEQRWMKKVPKEEVEAVEEEVEDIDDDSDDELFNSFGRIEDTSHPLDRRKASTHSGSGTFPGRPFSNNGRLSTKGPPAFASQRFATRAADDGKTREALRNADVLEDKRPWADRYEPENLEELAVHKKKVMDVRAWLLDAFSHPSRRVCILHRYCLICNR